MCYNGGMKRTTTICGKCGGEVNVFKTMGPRQPIPDITQIANGVFVVGICSKCGKFDYYKLPLKEGGNESV